LRQHLVKGGDAPGCMRDEHLAADLGL
jgi:hypothetical protein